MNLRRLEVHVPVPVLSRNRRQNRWEQARNTKVRRQASWLAARDLILLRSLHLDPRAPKRITFCAYMGQRMDGDNLDLKPYIDGLRDAGIIHDDSVTSGHVIDLNAEQVITPVGRRRLVIAVEFLEIPAPAAGAV